MGLARAGPILANCAWNIQVLRIIPNLLKKIRSNIHTDHFKIERVGKLKERVHAKGSINKKENALQKIRGVNRTAATLGLLPYSSVAKNKGHQAALEAELAFRGVAFEPEETTFNRLKKLLSEHEVKRVSADGNEQDITAAKKAFKKLSGAIFVGLDDIISITN